MADAKACSIFLCTFVALVVTGFQLFHQAEGLAAGLSAEELQYFSSKTRYIPRDQPFAGVPQNDQCKPLHIDMLSRHGTRFPSKGDVRKIEKMLETVNKLFSSGSPFRLGELTLPGGNPFTMLQDKLLSTVGEEELYNLSRRLRRRFEGLFDVPYSPNRFSFISTGTTRTTQSAMAFAFGLFEGQGRLGPFKFQPVALDSSKIENDPLLRFFDLCPKYSREVSENKTSLYEFEKFKRSLPLKEVIENVAARLKTSSGALSPADIVGMYVACSFEVALLSKTNGWCALFDVHDLQVVEYLYDLKHFWKRGYGYEINYKIACTLLSDIHQSLVNASNHDYEHMKYGTFRFAHGETLQPLYALLGLFQVSEKLRADNFDKVGPTQQYRTSQIVPFGANIAFVLYKCNSAAAADPIHQFKLQVFVNERLVVLPCCGSESLCPLAKFLHYYNKAVQSCDLKEHCRIETQQDVNNEHEEL